MLPVKGSTARFVLSLKEPNPKVLVARITVRTYFEPSVDVFAAFDGAYVATQITPVLSRVVPETPFSIPRLKLLPIKNRLPFPSQDMTGSPAASAPPATNSCRGELRPWLEVSPLYPGSRLSVQCPPESVLR